MIKRILFFKLSIFYFVLSLFSVYVSFAFLGAAFISVAATNNSFAFIQRGQKLL